MNPTTNYSNFALGSDARSNALLEESKKLLNTTNPSVTGQAAFNQSTNVPPPLNVPKTNVFNSGDLAQGITKDDVLAKRTEIENQYKQAQADQAALESQYYQAGQVSPEETAAAKSLASLTTDERNKQIALQRSVEREQSNATGKLEGGQNIEIQRLSAAGNRELADIALQKLAASDQLRVLSGLRTSTLDTIKDKLGFASNKVDRLLGIQKDINVLDRQNQQDARNTVLSIVEQAGGLTYDQLTPNEQMKVAGLAAQSGLGLSTVKRAMENGKVAYTEARQKTQREASNSILESTLKELQIKKARGELNTYVAGQSPAADAWISAIKNGTAKISNVPKELQTQVVAGLASQQTNPAISEVYTLASDLLNRGTDSITGVGQFFPSITDPLTINRYEQLKGLLSLESRQKLKGSGAISDFESRTLDRAASALGRNLSNEDFKQELTRIKGVFATASGLPVSVKVTKGKDVAEGELTREMIDDAIRQGYTVEYK